jgi:hypothetical protein
MTTGAKLKTPLGGRINPTHRIWHWYYNKEREELYHINGTTRLGNLFGIPQNSMINLIPELLNSGMFIGILFFDRKMCSHQF